MYVIFGERNLMRVFAFLCFGLCSGLLWIAMNGAAAAHIRENESSVVKKGYDVSNSDLVPIYPAGRDCSPLTSLYASWIDVDGDDRDTAHSGVDGGRLGEMILAPGPGTIHAVWEANWQWGAEGALLISHTSEQLNMPGHPPFYFTAYDHLRYDDIKHFKVGDKIARGQPLARVYRPGGHKKYLPEVHWEVWEAQNDKLQWITNRHGGREWRNSSARLIDPLFMLGINAPPPDGRSVQIVPYEADADYSDYRGFTYIFGCKNHPS